MASFTTSELIGKFGAREYLRNLRERLRRGKCSRERFAFLAARAYLVANKPLRALALLNTLDAEFCLGAGQPSVRELAVNATYLWTERREAACALNMIARDEEATIAGALDSVDDIMDEIVIGDTGSCDRTREIALQYGASVSSIFWEDDFSKARNQVIENTACEWIFWMDADDRLDQQCRDALCNLWRTAPPQAVAFCISNTTPGAPGPEFLQFRLFPRDKDIRFERRVHEQVVMSVARKGLPCNAIESIRITHCGYADRDTHIRKAARNKPLIQAAVAENPDDLLMRLSLGECHTILNEAPQAIAVFRDIADAQKNHARDPDAFAKAHLNAGRLFAAMGNTREAKRYLFRSLFLDPQALEAYYLLGTIFLAEKNRERAFYFFVKAAQLTPRLQLMAALDRTKIRMEALYHLASILLAWGRFSEAEETLDRAILVFPQVVQYYTLMGRALLAQAKLKGAAACFSQALAMAPQRNPDAYLGLATIFQALGNWRRASDFLRQAVKNDSGSMEVYTMIGDMNFAMRNSQEALAAYQSAISKGNGSTPEQVFLRAASSAMDLSKVEEARSLLEEALARNPCNAEALRMMELLSAELQTA